MDRYVLLLSWGERRGEGVAAGGPGAGTAAGRRDRGPHRVGNHYRGPSELAWGGLLFTVAVPVPAPVQAFLDPTSLAHTL